MIPPPRHVPFWVNFLVYLGLLAVAMYLTVPELKMIQLAYLFPIGILSFAGPDAKVLMPLAYGIHLVFLALFALIKRCPGVYVLWIVFALYLLLNAAGCREMLKGLSRIT